MNKLLKVIIGAVATLVVTEVFALVCPPGNPPTNCAPPPGWILDLALAGGSVPDLPTYNNYTVNFVATGATTNVSFAFREDPAFLYFDDVSVMDLTNPSGELIVNGGFESGLGPWVHLNTFGATFSGLVSNVGAANAHGGSFVWRDGSVQGYDGLTQSILTNPGDTYRLSFWLSDSGGLTKFQQLSDNGNVTGSGGNGIDVLAYAGRIPTLAVPEPTTIALFGLALAALAFARRKDNS